LGIEYSNPISGSGQCSNYAWRNLVYVGSPADTGRIQVSASLKNPGGTVGMHPASASVAVRSTHIALTGTTLHVTNLPHSTNAVLRLTDASGRTVLTRRVTAVAGAFSIGLSSSVTPGVYLAEIEVGESHVSQRLVLR
jgi:hypothetical protein